MPGVFAMRRRVAFCARVCGSPHWQVGKSLPRACSHRHDARVVCREYRRALVVDYGFRRVGLAVSVGFAPRPLPLLRHELAPADVAVAVAATARSTCSVDIVVGLPLTAKGAEGDQAVATRLFVDHLVEAAPWATIFLLDERFSTQLARSALINSDVSEERIPELLDSAAAAEIARRFFSDAQDVQPILVHKPRDEMPVVREDDSGHLEGRQDTTDSDAVERQSFLAWRKSAMARAAEEEKELNAKRRKRKKPHNGNT